MQWMIGAIASSPKSATIVKVDPAAKDSADKDFATLMTRLIAVDCVQFSKPAINSNRPDLAFKIAGQKLGELAMQEMLADKISAKKMEDFAKYIDRRAFIKLIDK